MTSALVARRLLLGLLLAAVLIVAAARPAAAHATLRSTSPADGATLEVAPAEVTLQFDQPVTADLGGIRVYDQRAEQLAAGAAEPVDGDSSRLRVALPDDVAAGTYVTTWAVTSEDGHPIDGAFVFQVGSGAIDEDAVATIFEQSRAGGAPLAVAASILRALVYAGTLLAVGGAIFLLAVHDREEGERRVLTPVALLGAGVAAVASVLSLATQGALLSGRGGAGLVDPRLALEVLGTSFGTSAIVRVAGLAVLLAALPRLWRTAATGATAAGAAAALVSFGLTGHTATASPRWLVAGANLAHTLAGAAWFGGIVLLLIALRRRRAADDPVGGGTLVARFSALATGAIVLVFAAGSTLAWAQVRGLSGLTGTSYGQTLLTKVGIVAAVLGVGAYNHFRLVPAIRRRSNTAWRLLQRTVRYEVIGLVIVVTLTGVLANTRPARSETGAGGAFSRYVDLGEEYQVNLTIDPNRAGVNEVHVYLLGADGRPVDLDGELTLGFSMPGNDIAPIQRDPPVAGPGHWSYVGPELSIPGSWVVDITARVGEFEQLSTAVPFTVNS